MNKVIILIAMFVFLLCFPIYGFVYNKEQVYLELFYVERLSTYYVNIYIKGVGYRRVMLDTGAGYTTINENVLSSLKKQDRAVRIGKITGILADGTINEYFIYKITIKISTYTLNDIEVVVFPKNTRMLLGLSVLKRFPSFNFDMKNSVIVFPGCPN